MVPPQDLYAHHISSYKQVLHAYHEEGLRQADHALTSSKVVLESEGEEMRRDQRERRLVVNGRNGTGKTTLIKLIMLVGQVSLPCGTTCPRLQT
jgi:ATPase subunit of ABC transporter with duplicated ATPase domains